MKTNALLIFLFSATLLIGTPLGFSQEFLNLNFESATIPKHTTNGMLIAASAAFPNWSVNDISSSGTGVVTTVGYNFISIGAAGVSIVDTNVQYFHLPFQGIYAALLFGSEGFTETLNQTGLVPPGTQSILMDVSFAYNFVVTLGGQTINMIPVKTLPDYTVYGGDISAFANQVTQLSIIAPPTGVPNAVYLDNIQFTTSTVPEPNEFALTGFAIVICGIFFISRKWLYNKNRRNYTGI